MKAYLSNSVKRQVLNQAAVDSYPERRGNAALEEARRILEESEPQDRHGHSPFDEGGHFDLRAWGFGAERSRVAESLAAIMPELDRLAFHAMMDTQLDGGIWATPSYERNRAELARIGGNQ